MLMPAVTLGWFFTGSLVRLTRSTMLDVLDSEHIKMARIMGVSELIVIGRDVLSRLLSGTGISLQVGFLSVALARVIGTVVALLSGYLGGWPDATLIRLTDIAMSMPYLMIAIVLAAVLGPSKKNINIILTVTRWAGYARVLRGEVLRIEERR